ncbi:GM2 ganglioside activator [Desmophyllum pertusum]|uniref:GM2 ganglioside activator n=1 Tax=Desmophyllum pertusum TaxID=174260 RepID=A0A9X0CPU0_9CNID|nr:GM2 ganglioside activator [Desmophyllum pertusum]
MAFAQIFVLVILAFAVDALKWSNCGGSSPPRKVLWWYASIPCIKNVGSCKYDIGCDKMKELLEGAQCPLLKKAYTVKQQTVTLPDISIPSFLTNGYYKITGDLREKGSNRRIACLEAELKITS